MALNDESRALLQILLVRRKDYGQIAALLGVETVEVRERAQHAVGDLTGQGAPLGQPVVDYMFGQADPIGRAEAVRILAEQPDQAKSFADVRDQLLLLYPASEIPEPPGASEPRKPRSRAATTGPATVGVGEAPIADEPQGATTRRLPAMDGRTRTVLAALVAAVALAGIVAVVILLGGGGAEQETSSEPPPPTRAVLSPTDGGRGDGEVEFGFAGRNFAANVALSDLAPNRDEEGYALWLEGPAGSFPFDSARVGQEGTITGQSQISQAIICFIAADLFTEVKVSRVGDAELTAALRDSVNRNVNQADFPDYVGETVLSGPISMPFETKDRIIEVCGGRNQAAGRGSPGS